MQYTQYLKNGGTMSIRQWEVAGQFDVQSAENYIKEIEIRNIRIEAIMAMIWTEHDSMKEKEPAYFADKYEAIAAIRAAEIDLELLIATNRNNSNLIKMKIQTVNLAAICVRALNELF